jgi:hypothetical protein
MVRAAHTLARTLGHHNTAFCRADAEALPLRHAACNLITSKLAFHDFPHPQVALSQMVRVAMRSARLVRIDRVSPEDAKQHAYQNRLEKLRTPNKTYVYSERSWWRRSPTPSLWHAAGVRHAIRQSHRGEAGVTEPMPAQSSFTGFSRGLRRGAPCDTCLLSYL